MNQFQIKYVNTIISDTQLIEHRGHMETNVGYNNITATSIRTTLNNTRNTATEGGKQCKKT
jgi:hypothetical protein